MAAMAANLKDENLKRLFEQHLPPKWEANSKRRRVSEGRMGSFEGLHTDLVLDILSLLSPADAIQTAGRVCKKWRGFAHSQDLKHLSRLRTAGNPWLGDNEPWMVLQEADNKMLLWYPSIDAVLNHQGRHLNPGSFSTGPPGHEFEFLASSLGLVCGRLLDLDEADSHDMTLAVGNASLVYCSRFHAWLPDEAIQSSCKAFYRVLTRVDAKAVVVRVQKASMPRFKGIIVRASSLEAHDINNVGTKLAAKVNKVVSTFLPNLANP